MAKKCYMCDQDSTSVEHVPPRCLFPEQKDLPPGVDLRKQLITVPACEEHNSSKSKDDEYLLYSLVLNLPANEIAGNHFLTKVMRAINNNPSLINNMLNDNHSVVIQDTITGQVHNTIAINLDSERLDGVMEMLARALYFHHRGCEWNGSVETHYEFLLATLDPKHQALNEKLDNLNRMADGLFQGKEFFGENPDVFKYQLLIEGEEIQMMRLHFYHGCKVLIMFVNK